MNRSMMPAGFRVPAHHHDHDELIVVLSGGCRFDDGLAELGPGELDRDPREHALRLHLWRRRDGLPDDPHRGGTRGAGWKRRLIEA